MRAITVALAADEELPRVIALVAAEFPELPIDERAVADVHQLSRNILAIKADGDVVGGFAALLLNGAGKAAMIDGSLQMARPPLHLLTRPGEHVEAAYVWMFVGRRYGMAARPEILRWVYARAPNVNIYGRPINKILMRLHSRDGVAPIFEGSPLWVLRAQPQEQAKEEKS